MPGPLGAALRNNSFVASVNCAKAGEAANRPDVSGSAVRGSKPASSKSSSVYAGNVASSVALRGCVDPETPFSLRRLSTNSERINNCSP